jgi:hypothetical protein
MSKLYGAAIEVQSFGDQQGWLACVIGGLAVIHWGEHHATEDVDFRLPCSTRLRKIPHSRTLPFSNHRPESKR